MLLLPSSAPFSSIAENSLTWLLPSSIRTLFLIGSGNCFRVCFIRFLDRSGLFIAAKFFRISSHSFCLLEGVCLLLLLPLASLPIMSSLPIVLLRSLRADGGGDCVLRCSRVFGPSFVDEEVTVSFFVFVAFAVTAAAAFFFVVASAVAVVLLLSPPIFLFFLSSTAPSLPRSTASPVLLTLFVLPRVLMLPS